MTPLMRAVQRNNVECVRYLLNNTRTDLNGSAQSTYTPLWFSVSNGYTDLALMLLNYNASPSMVDKWISSAIPLPTSVANTLLLQSEDMTGAISNPQQQQQQQHSSTTTTTASYLFSPLRASIVYARFQIMSYLLEFNANVYELFNVSRVEKRTRKLPRPGRGFNPKLNEDYVNSLKFFHRQFVINEEQQQQQTSTNQTVAYDLDMQLDILNEFIDDVNVYRRMLVEFVKNLIHR